MRFFVALILFSFICFLNADFINSYRTAHLEGQQVVPYENQSNLGTGVCTYLRNSNPPVLYCDLQTTYDLTVANITQIGIYNAARGFNGPLVYGFDSTTFQSNFNTLITNITGTDSYTAADQEADLLNGLWYIEVSSNIGNIRGQLENSDRVFSILDYRFTIPATLSSNAHGVALGVYSPSSPKRLLQLEVIHNVVNPTAIEVYIGTYGIVGPFAFSLHSYSSPVFDSIEVTIDEQSFLLDDYTYMTVPSSQNPDGDIRGQITTIDYLPHAKYTTRLNNVLTFPSSSSSAQGCAIWVYDCVTRILEYIVFHDVQNPTQVIVSNGIPGINGTYYFALSRPESPIYGSQQFQPGDELLFFNQSFYVTVYSNTYPVNVTGGEINGQIGGQFPYYSYISGSNVVPPVTTASLGCATFSIVGNNTLNYNIQFAVPYPLQVRLGEGPDGTNGIVDRVFPSNTTPVFGTDQILTTSELSLLSNELLYIEITSEAYPIDGEIRGQIYHINATCAVASAVTPFTYVFPPPPFFPIYVGASSTIGISIFIFAFIFTSILMLLM